MVTREAPAAYAASAIARAASACSGRAETTTSCPGWTLTPTRTTSRAYFSRRWSNGSVTAVSLLEVLGEVLGQVEGRGGLLVVDVLATRVAERVGLGRGGLLVLRGLLLGGLGGVAGHALALALL